MIVVVPTNHGEILGMSDEDFLKNSAPPAVIPSEEPVQGAADAAEHAAGNVETTTPEPVATETRTEAEIAADAIDDEPVKTEEEKIAEAAARGKTANDFRKETAGVEPKVPEAKPAVEQPKDPSTVGSNSGTPVITDYKVAYEDLLKPFKANGKMIELKSADEVRQLMQMGANYTKKMQDIQPHRKTLLMLENNGLLDEAQLSFLIDLHKKNPEAIKKLVKDSGIDPMEIDTTKESNYVATNHQVTDDEAQFRSTLDDLGSTDDGKATLQTINTHWDAESKRALWSKPEIMATIHQQREIGVYDRIVAEMDRQKLLGQIPATMPFLVAYKTVGDQLVAAKSFDNLEPVKPQPTVAVVKTPVATTVATPKATVVNNSKVDAAASGRVSPRRAAAIVNPLAMSDEEFMQNFANRV